MNKQATRVITIAALIACSVLAGSRPAVAQAGTPALTSTATARPALVLAQATTTPPASAAAPADQPIGLPRVKDYEPVSELRDIYFDFGASSINPEEMKVLDANAAWLRAHPQLLVLIEGHCDNRGTTGKKNEFNIDLGERRAQAAMNHLVAQGVQPSRITILSYGEERPQCTEESERCWKQNRRSRFLVKPR